MKSWFIYPWYGKIIPGVILLVLYEAIARRRSIRKYVARPVEPEKLERVLEATRQAPSWKNLQCWRFIVIQDVWVKQDLTETAVPETNPGRKALLQAPAVIALCADLDDSEVWKGKPFYMLDAGLAMEHLFLAATAEGLGSFGRVFLTRSGCGKS